MRKSEIEDLLTTMLESHDNVSDLNITVDRPLQVEAAGELVAVPVDPPIESLTPFQTEIFALNLFDERAELDRFAQLAWVRFDARRSLMRERIVLGGASGRATLDTTLDHLPERERAVISAGGQFVDFHNAEEYARLFALTPFDRARLRQQPTPKRSGF